LVNRILPATDLAHEKILAILTTAPENGATTGGLKVVTEEGCFAGMNIIPKVSEALNIS